MAATKPTTEAGHSNTSWQPPSEPREVKWEPVSKTHRKILGQLVAMMKTNPSNCTRIDSYSVCFDERFCIGKGCSDTRVYVGLSTTGREVAVKRLPRDLYNEIGKNEARILMKQCVSKANHVLRLLHFGVVGEYGYLILNLCEQTLKEYVASHTKEDLKKNGARIISQILLGLQTLHCGAEESILHRDLKPSNILVDTDNDFFLSDMGISRIIANAEQTYHTGLMGTHGWMATESLLSYGDGEDVERKIMVNYKRESDVQVAGMLLFYILTKGKHPYGQSWVDQCYNIKKGDAVDLDKLDESAPKDLIKWMLEKEPQKRPSLGDCLNHPFLRACAEQFDTISRVGNQAEIKANDTTSPVVQQLNKDPLVVQQWSEITQEMATTKLTPEAGHGTTSWQPPSEFMCRVILLHRWLQHGLDFVVVLATKSVDGEPKEVQNLKSIGPRYTVCGESGFHRPFNIKRGLDIRIKILDTQPRIEKLAFTSPQQVEFLCTNGTALKMTITQTEFTMETFGADPRGTVEIFHAREHPNDDDVPLLTIPILVDATLPDRGSGATPSSIAVVDPEPIPELMCRVTLLYRWHFRELEFAVVLATQSVDGEPKEVQNLKSIRPAYKVCGGSGSHVPFNIDRRLTVRIKNSDSQEVITSSFSLTSPDDVSFLNTNGRAFKIKITALQSATCGMVGGIPIGTAEIFYSTRDSNNIEEQLWDIPISI